MILRVTPTSLTYVGRMALSVRDVEKKNTGWPPVKESSFWGQMNLEFPPFS